MRASKKSRSAMSNMSARLSGAGFTLKRREARRADFASKRDYQALDSEIRLRPCAVMATESEFEQGLDGETALAGVRLPHRHHRRASYRFADAHAPPKLNHVVGGVAANDPRGEAGGRLRRRRPGRLSQRVVGSHISFFSQTVERVSETWFCSTLQAYTEVAVTHFRQSTQPKKWRPRSPQPRARTSYDRRRR